MQKKIEQSSRGEPGHKATLAWTSWPLAPFAATEFAKQCEGTTEWQVRGASTFEYVTHTNT